MRRTLLTLLFTLALATDAIAAQGVNLRWNACLGDGGTLNRDFACNTNTGSEVLAVSFVLDSSFASVTGIRFELDFSTPSGLPGAWWQFKNTDACRRTALVAAFAPPAGSATCVDPWLGLASGNISGYAISGSLDRMRLTCIGAVSVSQALTLEPGIEYGALRLTVSHANTVGAGSCAGCSTPACMGIRQVRINRPVGMGDPILATECEPRSSVASWQGSPVVSDYVNGGDRTDFRAIACQSTSRSRNRTWGTLKSLYR